VSGRALPSLTPEPPTGSAAFGATDWAMLLSVAAIWGSSFLLIDIALEAFSPAVIAALRVTLGATALAFVPRARRIRIDRQDHVRVALLGVAAMGIPLLLFPIAQQWIESSIAGMINGAMPLTTALWATMLLRRPPGRWVIAGLIVGFAGVVAIVVPQTPTFGTGSMRTALGVGLALIAVVMYGLAANLAVPLGQRYGALPVLLRAQLAAMVILIPNGVRGSSGSSFAWGPAVAMLPLGVLGTGAVYVLMVTLVGRVGSTRGATAAYLVPLVAVLLGVTIAGDVLPRLALAGVVLVLAGAWLSSRPDLPAARHRGPQPRRRHARP
jgi:drug/metabolite transporter (DMT)-like permease